MADNATECAKTGNYNSDDEKLIQFKARTIIKCFVNSDLPPRVRVRTFDFYEFSRIGFKKDL